MMRNAQEKCLYCYKPLNESETADFHPACSKKIFGTEKTPLLPYTKKQIYDLASDVIRSQTAITGAQPKLSLDLEKGDKDFPKRFTIIGLWGRYILKPQTEMYQNLPEFEDLTMHLAELSGIKVVPHSLIRFEDKSLCYITKRIDRNENGNKIHMEDMCQLTERLTEDKYKGSYEQIAKQIQQHSKMPGLDLIAFAEQLVFCFLTGNSDMHLKNFSLIKHNAGYQLSAAYDMLPTNLILSEDTEETALLLNGTKKKINKEDFEKAFQTMKIDSKSVENIFEKFKKTVPDWFGFIDQSFLPEDMKKNYKTLVQKRAEKLRIL
ncbi:MAG: HipA domain-containing protein [Methanosarcinales archaeon]|nr:HipA domain-containing protein [Methanosarcinales archaeon]